MSYFGTSRALDESILDSPKEDLDPEVWTLNADGEYIPTTYASKKIDAVVQWAVSRFGITDPVVHITGSIGSNSFGQESDIDVHFCSETFEPGDIDEFNREFREAFALEFGPETGSETGKIGTHPIEVYYQENPYQDMMSVGCYDYLNRKWEAGPEIKDTAFDPYSEYYEKDMKYVGKLANDVRNQILDVYEKALVIRKSTDPRFKDALFRKMLKSLKEAAKLFTSMRNKRKVMSSPKSKEDALRMRKDRKWHVADSAFKLFDRFGYLGVLRAYTQLSEKAADGEPNMEEYVDAAISAVEDGLSNNKMLSDSELTEGEVPGMAGWDDADLKADIRGWLDERVEEYQLDIEIIDIALHGSRTRKDFRPDSDLDVIVYYKGRPGGHVKEDHIWNMLNDEPKCEIDGVPVDFWPTRDEESGSLDDVLARNREFDARKANAEKIWVDDVRPAPEGYRWFKSTDDFIEWYRDIGEGAWKRIACLDTDHDAGDYAKFGGDYSKILDFLEFCEVPELRVRIHSQNPVGAQKMRAIVKKNGWTEYSELEEADLEEGFGSALRNAALAGMMLAPGIAGAKTVQQGRSVAKPAAVQTARTEKKYGKLSASNMKNLLATIAYNETMLDWLKYRDDDEIIAALNTIDNRAGGDPSNYAFVIGEKSQYFGAKHVRGGYEDSSYVTYDPNEEAKTEGGQLSKSQKECWRLCQEYAQ